MEKWVARGYGFATVYYCDIEPDSIDGAQSGALGAGEAAILEDVGDPRRVGLGQDPAGQAHARRELYGVGRLAECLVTNGVVDRPISRTRA